MAINCPRCQSENSDTSRFCANCAAPLGDVTPRNPSLTKTLAIPVNGLAKGTMIGGKYRILGEIGRGGMGIVYKAEDTKLQRTIALKFLPTQWTSDIQVRERFIQEARAASALDHPNICTIYEIGETDDRRMFIAMGFYEGDSLRDKLRRGPLNAEEAVEVAIQIALGMEKAHGKDIIHRDIKPANILITTDGVAKIVDFGLAKLAGQVRLTKEGSTVGTVAYMSPEQAKGAPVDKRTDIWSLGIVLYEMVSGRLPFKGDYEQSLIHSILKMDPEPIEKRGKDIPKGLESIILRALEKNPAARYQGMGELVEDLRAVAEGLKPLRARSRLFRGRVLGIRKLHAYAGLAGLAILIVAAMIITSPGRRTLDSIAVLPLQNLSGDPEQEYFSDGMTEDLITKLAEISALKVISQISVMQYKGTKKLLPQIARELNVKAVVTGSVAREGGRVRVTAHLIRASTDQHLWAATYERDLQSMLVLRSEIAAAIAEKIRAAMTPAERARMVQARTVDPEVYDTTLKGKAILEYWTNEGQVRQAIGLFQSAIDRDPTYAPAWAGLSEATWNLAVTGLEVVDPAEVRAKSIAAAQRALELDETLPDAHKACAIVATDGEWDLAKAQRHFERALELRPGYAAALNAYGQFLGGMPLTRWDEARRFYTRAKELDPLSPWNDINMVAWWLYQGRLEQALAEGKRARERNPQLWVIAWQMGFARLLLGQPSQAVPDFEAAVNGDPTEMHAAVLAALSLAYGLAGRRDEALRILTDMEQASHKRYVSPFFLAVAYSGLGQMDEAFRLADRALEQKTPWLSNYAVYDNEPMSIALRRDPRWKPYLERLRRLVRLPAGSPDSHS